MSDLPIPGEPTNIGVRPEVNTLLSASTIADAEISTLMCHTPLKG